jgi:hypothetical protein
MVVVPLVWGVPQVASLALGTLAVLFLLFAIWLRFSWLLLPTLAAAHILVISICNITYTAASPWQATLTIVYAIFGVTLILVSYWLQRRGKLGWAWPLLAFALLDLAATYLSALILGGWMAIGLSAVYALLAFWLAWAERDMPRFTKWLPLLVYLGVTIVFAGHFYLIAFNAVAKVFWPAYTTGLCALLVVFSWLARRGELQRIFGIPLHNSGIALMLIPLLGTVIIPSPGLRAYFNPSGIMVMSFGVLLPEGVYAILPVITFAIASAIFFIDAIIWRNWFVGYLGTGAFTILIWYVFTPWVEGLTIAYAMFGVALVLGSYWLQRLGMLRRAWPLLAFASLALTMTYVSALVLGGWLAIGLSAGYALLAIWLAWAEKDISYATRLSPLFAYLAVGLVFIGHFYVLATAGIGWIIWAPYTAGLCALFVGLSWLVRRGELDRIYGTPLHHSGVFLMVIPLIGAAVMSSQWLWMSISSPGDTFVITTAIPPLITFAIAGVIFSADAILRRDWLMGYLGGGAIVVVVWYALSYLGVQELQAYVIPAGLGLLLLGWNEHRQTRRVVYLGATLIGLAVLMVSVFYQSASDSKYAALLLVECLLSIGWGIRMHSRIYVQAGGLALLVLAVAQLGPAFFELPRWVEIGIIGSLLLGGGLLALFRREQIVSARKNLSAEWKKWQP